MNWMSYFHRAGLRALKKVIKSAEDVFIEFLQVKGISVESCMHSNDVLDNAVKEFFITVKRKDGERYKSKSLHTQVRRETENRNRKQKTTKCVP